MSIRSRLARASNSKKKDRLQKMHEMQELQRTCPHESYTFVGGTGYVCDDCGKVLTKNFNKVRQIRNIFIPERQGKALAGGIGFVER